MNSYIILFIIVAYFGILLLIAWITGRKSSSNEAFFLGNRKSPWYIVSIGMVGTSLSGVTFVSVPGMVRSIDMTYMQTVLGFFFGYILIAKVLLPLYYKLQLTSIYSYLDDRIGQHSYKTGASFFLLSKIVGAAARLYLVVLILQHYVFAYWNISFAVTVVISIFLVLALHLSGWYQNNHLDRHTSGVMPSRHANRNYLAGERQDATGFCRHGADLASQPALPYLRVRRLVQHTTFHETVF